jgi:hypothetical protein
VSLCRFYEHARYALLSTAADPLIIFPSIFPAGAFPHLHAAKQILGPTFCLVCFLPAKVKFPQMPYRQARKLLPGDPQTLSAIIEEFCAAETPTYEKLEFYVLAGAFEKARELVAQLNELKAKPPSPLPKRGAGARIRQERTDLKYLGATKLLRCMTAPEAERHTEEALGKPLFGNESEWSRAKARAQRTLAPYRAEAALLCKALGEKRSLKSFSYSGGDPQINWA